jgi:hypothetical protein
MLWNRFNFKCYEPPESKAQIHQESCHAIIRAEIVAIPADGFDRGAAALLRPA